MWTFQVINASLDIFHGCRRKRGKSSSELPRRLFAQFNVEIVSNERGARVIRLILFAKLAEQYRVEQYSKYSSDNNYMIFQFYSQTELRVPSSAALF